MADYKIGDKVKVIVCSAFTQRHINHEGVLKELYLIGSKQRYRVTIKCEDGTKELCDADEIQFISSANTMAQELRELSEGQKQLPADTQVLLELGVINDKLELEDKDYVLNFLFRTNIEAVAKQAKADVAIIKGKQEKERKKKEKE